MAEAARLRRSFAGERPPAAVSRALCWSHARRKFCELADNKATARKGKKVAKEILPIALDAVRRNNAIFDIEREITGPSAGTAMMSVSLSCARLSWTA